MLQIPRVHWLFVDDGSTDSTSEILKEVSVNPNVNILRLPKNAGKSEAVRTGMNKAFEDQESFFGVGFIDSDGAFEVSEVASVLEKCGILLDDKKNDALWTSRVQLAGRNIQRSQSRHYVGRVLATVFSHGAIAIPYDTQCGFKVFSVSHQLQENLKDTFRTRWLFELEMLSRWNRDNKKPMAVWEEPLGYWKEIGDSKITFREVRRIAKEVVLIKFIQRRAMKS
jgi:glycosyltransferase involved in cell wall biosynthesis